jgi:hypothetical protein
MYMRTEASDVFLSMAETRELLRMSRVTVTKLIENGELVAMKGPAKNSPFRISRASIENYIARNTINARSGA